MWDFKNFSCKSLFKLPKPWFEKELHSCFLGYSRSLRVSDVLRRNISLSTVFSKELFNGNDGILWVCSFIYLPVDQDI